MIVLPVVLFTLAYFAPERLSTTIFVSLSDPYERRLIDATFVPQEFYASFSTVYQIDNRNVKLSTFWDTPLLKSHIQIKAVKKSGFWFVTRMNLLTGEEK